jgi:hypothetical protein
MNQKIFFFFSLLLISIFLFNCPSNNIYSYPKFSSYTGEKCMSCHVNPTGAGMRNAYGVKYAKENLFLKFLEKANKTTDIEPQVSKGIRIGGDMRMLYLDDQVDHQPNLNSFFQMQGDLYVHATVNKYIGVLIAPGIYLPDTYSPNPFPVKYEIYGIVSQLPAGLYFKVGRFIPNFGIRIPEHSAYNRIYNDLYTPFAPDAGIEAGISPGPFTLTASLTNGSSTNIAGQTNNSFDFDTQKQVTVSGDFRWASKKSKYTFGLGGSFINNPYKFDPVNNINAVRNIAAGFFSIGLFQRVSLMGEFSYNRLKIRDALSSQADQKIVFGELDYMAVKGIELKLMYENYNPKVGIPDNTSERQRYSFGVMCYPLTGLELEAIYRVVKEGKGDGPVPFNLQNNEFQVDFKFYF